MRLRIYTIGLLLFALGTATALAAGGTVLEKTTTRKLAAGKTTTFKVGYPDALKYGASKYSGSVKILAPAPGSHGAKPSLHKVHVLSKGSCLGGSDYCVKVRNGNRSGTAAVRMQITAITQLPPGKKP